MSKLNVLGSQILVERKQKQQQSEGGIYIPNQQEDKPEGVVVALGPECTKVKVDDYVIFLPWVGTPIQIGSQKSRRTYLAMKEDDIIAVLTQETQNA